MRKLLTTLLLFSCLPVLAHEHLEKEYQNYWAKKYNAKTEVVLEDKARVDCLTDEYAVEVDFAKKWAESTINKYKFYYTLY